MDKSAPISLDLTVYGTIEKAITGACCACLNSMDRRVNHVRPIGSRTRRSRRPLLVLTVTSVLNGRQRVGESTRIDFHPRPIRLANRRPPQFKSTPSEICCAHRNRPICAARAYGIFARTVIPVTTNACTSTVHRTSANECKGEYRNDNCCQQHSEPHQPSRFSLSELTVVAHSSNIDSD